MKHLKKNDSGILLKTTKNKIKDQGRQVFLNFGVFFHIFLSVFKSHKLHMLKLRKYQHLLSELRAIPQCCFQVSTDL